MSEPAEFVHEFPPVRVLFGAGRRREVPAELDRLDVAGVMIVCGRSGADTAHEIGALLGERCLGVLAEATMHVPVERAESAARAVEVAGPDGLIAVGGGSSVGLAKAVARRLGLPIIAVPTTYAGSEMTPIWGETAAGAKTTGRDLAVVPRVAIYDPELTVSLPRAVSLTSAFNAAAHAVEALYAPDRTPITSLMAAEALRSFFLGLPQVAATPHDLAARSLLLRAAWLAGSVLGSTTMGLHHALCHAVGGALNLDHAGTHTVLLPHVLAFTAPAVPDVMANLGVVLDTVDPAAALWQLCLDLGGPTSLTQLGMTRADLPRVVEAAATRIHHHPKPVSAEDLAELVGTAIDGSRPSGL